MNKELLVDLVQRLPQGTVSRAWGWLVRRKKPRVAVKFAKRAFVKAFGLDMTEAAESQDAFASLEDLFVRRLKASARRIDPRPEVVVSPCDGKVGICGKVEDGTLLQVKGRSYSLARLLGSEEDAARFDGGAYATIYLAPKDYHRVHAPASGEVREAVVIPGQLLPVFPEAIERVDELFARNERLITYVDTTSGRLAIVKVGATMVGRISVAYDDSLRTNKRGQKMRRVNYDPARLVQKGAELGTFELGSTVVLIGEAGKFEFDALEPGQTVRMGEHIGTVLQRKRVNGKRSKTITSDLSTN
jgi:phosphatidylserine decarboxylase